jgi:exodeoxyribonuclease VII small subunit
MSEGRRKGKGKDEALPFEDMLQRLETIVADLEGGERPLEESIRLFEEGLRLSQQALHRLDEAERRVSLLLTQDGVEKQVPFPEGEDEAP